MAKLILDTDAALYEALGFLKQAELLMKAVRGQDPDSYELTDAHTLTQDALSQLTGEIANRVEAKWSAA
jgi:hypothetical protein